MPTIFLCPTCDEEYDGPGNCLRCDVELVSQDEVKDDIDRYIDEEEGGGFGMSSMDSYDDGDGI